MSGAAAPAPWLVRHEALVREAARRGPVLDVACGRGRHARLVADWGLTVVALDRNPEALAELAQAAPGRVHALRADLESAPGPPLRPGVFGAVLVFRYLHRPLARTLADWLAPGGLLVYETFTTHQRELGYGPGNAAFLLEPGELPRLFPGLDTLAFHEGLSDGERPLHLASLVARRPEGLAS